MHSLRPQRKSYCNGSSRIIVNLCFFVCVFRRQLTALAMLLLDPYYRTIEGFEVLFRLLHFGNAQLTNCFILKILPCLVFMLGSDRKGMDQFWTQIPAGTSRLFLLRETLELLAISHLNRFWVRPLPFLNVIVLSTVFI